MAQDAEPQILIDLEKYSGMIAELEGKWKEQPR